MRSTTRRRRSRRRRRRRRRSRSRSRRRGGVQSRVEVGRRKEPGKCASLQKWWWKPQQSDTREQLQCDGPSHRMERTEPQ